MAVTPVGPALGSALAERRAARLRLRRCRRRRRRLGNLCVLSQPLLKGGVSEPAPAGGGGGRWQRVGAVADAWAAGQERGGGEKRGPAHRWRRRSVAMQWTLVTPSRAAARTSARLSSKKSIEPSGTPCRAQTAGQRRTDRWAGCWPRGKVKVQALGGGACVCVRGRERKGAGVGRRAVRGGGGVGGDAPCASGSP